MPRKLIFTVFFAIHPWALTALINAQRQVLPLASLLLLNVVLATLSMHNLMPVCSMVAMSIPGKQTN